ncbi:MAG: hypothetical protein ACPGNT_06470 [Rhodospirillales bacterium]
MRWDGFFLAVALSILLAACSPARMATVEAKRYPADTFVPGFSPELALRDWWYLGPDDGMRADGLGFGLRYADMDRIPTLQANAGLLPYTAVRTVNSPITVKPFLTWSWRLDGGPLPDGPHPVHLAIGFGSGDQPQQGKGPLPEHDRVLLIRFGGSALARGSFDVTTETGSAVVYVQRGGRENRGRWFTELVDLAGLYHSAWPDAVMTDVRVRFIGVRSLPAGDVGARAAFVGIDLTR